MEKVRVELVWRLKSMKKLKKIKINWSVRPQARTWIANGCTCWDFSTATHAKK